MSAWPVVIPGEPSSGNELGIRRRYRRTAGGTTVSYPSIGKRPEVEAYQAGAIQIIKTARPSGWVPPEVIRIDFRLYLTHDMDFDNVFKVVDDAVAAALGVNDSRFRPTPISKEIVKMNPRVWLAIGPFIACQCCGR
jgi:Holliday junction resolvase RusA-like endonuclease